MRNIFKIGSVNLLIGLVSFLFTIYITRMANPAELGFYALVLLLKNLIMQFGDVGILTYSITKDKLLTPKLLRDSMLISLSFVLVCVFIGISLSDFEQLALLVVIAFICLCSKYFSAYAEAHIIRKEDFSELAKIDFLSNIVFFYGLQFVLLVFGLMSLVEAIMFSLPIFFLSRLIWAIKLQSYKYFSGENDLVTNQKLLTYIIPLNLVRTVNFGFNTIEAISIKLSLGVEAIGIYSRMTTLNNVSVNYFGVFADKFGLKKLSSGERLRENKRFLFEIFFPVVMLISICVYYLIFHYAEQIVEWIYGERWGKFSNIFAVLSLAIGSRVLNKFVDSVIKIVGAFKFKILTQITLTVVWGAAILFIENIEDFLIVAQIHVLIMTINFAVSCFVILNLNFYRNTHLKFCILLYVLLINTINFTVGN